MWADLKADYHYGLYQDKRWDTFKSISNGDKVRILYNHNLITDKEFEDNCFTEDELIDRLYESSLPEEVIENS